MTLPSASLESVGLSAIDLTRGLLGVSAVIAEKPLLVDPIEEQYQLSTPFSTTSQPDWVEAVRLWNENGRDLIGGLPRRPCPVCGEPQHRELFQSYDGYPHAECVACGCWYVPLAVDAQVFERFFERCPAALAVLERTFGARRSETSRQTNLDRIGAYLDVLVPLVAGARPASLRYLDLGCGLGQSLVAARQRGLDAVGVESSRQCIDVVRAEGLTVFHASDDWLQGRTFDLISMWESLEHMVDPLAVLEKSAGCLAPGGLLAFTVPNLNCPLVRTQRQDCSFIHGGYDTPGHINLFNPATIERLLQRAGFELLALDGQYGLNLSELVSYLTGKHRGAFDMLREQPVSSSLSAETEAVIRAIGPAFALFERVTLTAPILFGIACRKQDAAHRAGAVAAYQDGRRKDVMAQIRACQPAYEGSNDEPSSGPDQALIEEPSRGPAEGRIEELEEQLQLARAQLAEPKNALARLGRWLRDKINQGRG